MIKSILNLREEDFRPMDTNDTAIVLGAMGRDKQGPVPFVPGALQLPVGMDDGFIENVQFALAIINTKARWANLRISCGLAFFIALETVGHPAKIVLWLHTVRRLGYPDSAVVPVSAVLERLVAGLPKEDAYRALWEAQKTVGGGNKLDNKTEWNYSIS